MRKWSADSNYWLLTPEEFEQLPDGTELTCIDGKTSVKGKDPIDMDTRGGLTSFVTEALTGAWINAFMTHTRKIWTKQTGVGSQNQEPHGYILLADTVKEILKAEHEELGEDEDE